MHRSIIDWGRTGRSTWSVTVLALVLSCPPARTTAARRAHGGIPAAAKTALDDQGLAGARQTINPARAKLPWQAWMMENISDIQSLVDIEAIKQLKSRYCRLIDLKEWETLGHLFTEDVHVDLGDEGRFSTRSSFIDYLRERFAGATTVHQAHLPEIELEGPDRATGLWAMDDHVEVTIQDGRRVHTQAYGYHEEQYRKLDGVWRVARIMLFRIRFETLPSAEVGI